MIRWNIMGLTALTLLAGCATLEHSADNGAIFERFSYQGQSEERVQAGAGEFRNPILSGYYPDPSVTRVNEDYYLVNSTFTNFPGLPIFHSRDLVSWRQIGNAITRPGQFDFSGLGSSRGIYAPDISYHAGTFYIVTTCVDCGGNVVMTATDPAGPWSEPKVLGFEGIDPSIFWDADGKAYIVNNGAPAETPRYDGHRAIWIQQFDPVTLAMKGERTLLVNGGVDISKKPSWIEGPHVLKRGNWFYLTAAEGGTGDQHSQVVFRSTSLRGPFVPYDHNPILSQRTLDPRRANPVTSAGHAKLVQTQTGEWWATFLATRPYGPDLYNIGRETFLLPVTWQNDWPHILDDGKRIPFTLPKPALPAQEARTAGSAIFSGDFSYNDEFDGDRLADQWIGVRVPTTPFYRIAEGKLHLTAGGRLGDLTRAPSFLARRQQHHIATIATTVSYTPRANNDRAGLVAYQSDTSHLFFGLTRIDDKNVVALFTRAQARQDVLVASAPAPTGPVDLVLRAQNGKMSFDYVVDGQRRTLAEGVDATFLSTKKAAGFVGTIIGPYIQSAK
jgi:xylan 1,4-beta-xylosidase